MMTSKQMRSDPLFMRNEFKVTGKWGIPIIKNQNIPLENLQLIAYSDTKNNDNSENKKSGVHFFVDDYRFIGIYSNPKRSLNKLSQYAFLLSAGNSYVLLDKDGVFHQYREYNNNHEIILEIGYHHEKKLGQGDVLHAHIHTQPGISRHKTAIKIKLSPGYKLYEKYKHLFVGVK